jgi:hypothetical protein
MRSAGRFVMLLGLVIALAGMAQFAWVLWTSPDPNPNPAGSGMLMSLSWVVGGHRRGRRRGDGRAAAPLAVGVGPAARPTISRGSHLPPQELLGLVASLRRPDGNASLLTRFPRLLTVAVGGARIAGVARG